MSSSYSDKQKYGCKSHKVSAALALSLCLSILYLSVVPVQALETKATAAAAGNGMPVAGAAQETLDSQLDIYQKALDDGTLREAGVQKLADLATKYPTNARVHLLFGRAYDALGLADDAVEQYKLADKYGPKDPEAIAAILHNVLSKGGGEAANTLLNSAIERFPDNPKLLFMIGKRLRENRHGFQAFKTLTHAYQLNQYVQGLPTELAAMIVDRDPFKAIELCREDLARKPDFAPALLVESKAMIFLTHYPQALVPLHRLYLQSPTHAESTQLYARCLYWCGYFKQSLEPSLFLLLNDSEAVVPELKSAENLASVLAHLPAEEGEIGLAQFYEKADKEKLTIPAPFHYFMGRIFYRQNKFAQAKGELLRFIASDPKSPDTLYMLGVIAENYDHDYDTALKYYRLAHALLPYNQVMAAACLKLEQREAEIQNDWASDFRDWLYQIFAGRKH